MIVQESPPGMDHQEVPSKNDRDCAQGAPVPSQLLAKGGGQGVNTQIKTRNQHRQEAMD